MSTSRLPVTNSALPVTSRAKALWTALRYLPRPIEEKDIVYQRLGFRRDYATRLHGWGLPLISSVSF